MYLHEYQSKNLLKRNNILIPKSLLINNLNGIKDFNKIFTSENVVLKAQIYSGSRAKFGGIIIVKNIYDDIHNAILNLLNTRISTNQTCGDEKKIELILVEEFLNFNESFYLSFILDRVNEKISFVISKESGSNIEDIESKLFLKIFMQPLFGVSDYQVRAFLDYLKLNYSYFTKSKIFLNKLLKMFIYYDLVLLEINPLVLFNKNFYCLDIKIDIDDNSLFRHEEISLLSDNNQFDLFEIEAKKFNLNYISLTGTIGCIVNGAGLAMATMDFLKIKGCEPANFLDIGGDADEKKIFNAIRILFLNKNISCIFINIFGGIVKCDIVANSIISAIANLNINIPFVIRLVGNMSHLAFEILSKSDFNIYVEKDLDSAVKKIIYLKG